MRAPPAFQVTIRRFGIWQFAVAFLAAAAIAAVGAWVRLFDEAASLREWLLAGAAVVAIGVALCGLRLPPLRLRWDGHDWLLGCAAAPAEADRRGRIEVTIDLSSWMLLRFVDESGRAWRRTAWIPAQRRGLEEHWHALRCAVYSTRAASSPGAPKVEP